VTFYHTPSILWSDSGSPIPENPAESLFIIAADVIYCA